MDIDKIKEILSERKSDLQNRGVKQIGVFGSFVRNEQTKDSDVDILVEFETIPSIFSFIQIESYLEEALGRDVDLVTKGALKPRIGKHILDEVVYV